MTTIPNAQDEGQGTAAAAADESKRVGGIAAEEVHGVAGDVKEQAQQLLDDTMQQVNEQSSAQRDRLVDLLRTLSNDLREMADRGEGSGLAGQLVRQGADRAETVSKSLDGREPSDILDEVRAFARRRPGAFLFGALAAGVIAGRFGRGAQKAQKSQDSSGTGATPSDPMPLSDSAVDAPQPSFTSDTSTPVTNDQATAVYGATATSGFGDKPTENL
jgi:hypothetical protein